MPDSLPPPSSWGIPSYDERDLDALLSGEVTDIPMALRPLADALIALRGQPTLAELRGEAAIRAEFRAQAGLSPSGSARPGERTKTRELPTLRPGSRPRRAARHRVRRPASRRSGTLLATAAAATIVGAVAFTGNLPGPFQSLTGLSTATPTAASSAAVRPTSPNLQDRSASSVRAVPYQDETAGSSPSSSVSELCQTFFSYLEPPVNGQQWWKLPAYGKLSVKAGGSSHILHFCLPYLNGKLPHDLPGSLGTSQSDQGNQGASNSGQSSSSSRADYPNQGAS